MSDEGPTPRTVTVLDGDAARALRRIRQRGARIMALGLLGLAMVVTTVAVGGLYSAIGSDAHHHARSTGVIVGILTVVCLISLFASPVCVVAGARKLTRARRIRRILEHSGWATDRARVLLNKRGHPSSFEVATVRQSWQRFMIVGSNAKLAAGIRDTERIEIARTVGAKYLGVVRAPGTGALYLATPLPGGTKKEPSPHPIGRLELRATQLGLTVLLIASAAAATAAVVVVSPGAALEARAAFIEQAEPSAFFVMVGAILACWFASRVYAANKESPLQARTNRWALVLLGPLGFAFVAAAIPIRQGTSLQFSVQDAVVKTIVIGVCAIIVLPLVWRIPRPLSTMRVMTTDSRDVDEVSLFRIS